MAALTREEFEQQYAARSGVTIEELRRLGCHAEPCACADESCRGWQMVTNMRATGAVPTFTPESD